MSVSPGFPLRSNPGLIDMSLRDKIQTIVQPCLMPWHWAMPNLPPLAFHLVPETSNLKLKQRQCIENLILPIGRLTQGLIFRFMR